ncbi:hypothetical protein RRG08_061612 [Elysia crispata]|uniref:Uncharacterized protein n=1 Tax=Elysia crispata TaxID=231223 RepID=A0AAE0YUM8_9GAST|nr:hypothetical protein RRG08_061612 [Elysia crispata]
MRQYREFQYRSLINSQVPDKTIIGTLDGLTSKQSVLIKTRPRQIVAGTRTHVSNQTCAEYRPRLIDVCAPYRVQIPTPGEKRRVSQLFYGHITDLCGPSLDQWSVLTLVRPPSTRSPGLFSWLYFQADAGILECCAQHA